jgi:nitrite reductase/ring-hydroxylating ferredoxin subunit
MLACQSFATQAAIRSKSADGLRPFWTIEVSPERLPRQPSTQSAPNDPRATVASVGQMRFAMGKCVQCGNDYDKSFEVTMGGRTLVFDSFECAIAMLAPVCPHCGCRIIGHGVQHGDTIYCCVHCAKHEGVKGLVDRD